MVNLEPERWTVVDAGKGWEEVQSALRTAILDKIK
jgi:thymidylate kinase